MTENEYRQVPEDVAASTVRRARAVSHRVERDPVVSERAIGHAIVGIAAFVVFAAIVPLIGGVVTFVLAIATFYVGLRSLTFAISIKLDDPWGWNRDGGMSAPFTWSDRAVLAGIAWFHRRSSAVSEPPPAAVRVLPFEPPE
jgi:hypothetical protein